MPSESPWKAAAASSPGAPSLHGVVTWRADASGTLLDVQPGPELLGHGGDAWRAPGFLLGRMHAEDRSRVKGMTEARQDFVTRVRIADAGDEDVALLLSVRFLDGLVHGLLVPLAQGAPGTLDVDQSERRLDMVVDQIPAILWTTDRDLRITSSRGRGLAALGEQQNQNVGRTLFEVVSQDPDALPVAAHLRALGGASTNYEYEWQGRHYATHVEPYVDEHGAIVGTVGLAFDMTERILAERSRDEQARESIRLREEFLSIASHELRTPVTSLGLALEHAVDLLRDTAVPPDASRSIGLAQRQVRRLGRLVEALLDVSRIQAGRVELHRARMSLAALVRQVAEDTIPAGQPFRLVADGDVDGDWDESRLEQVVTNLVSNAVKYGAGGPIEITLQGLGEAVRLTVRDEGIGIPLDRQSIIFARFERAAPIEQGPGLGLGLFITRELVRAHGGAIDVESAPDAGASFHVTLPRFSPTV